MAGHQQSIAIAMIVLFGVEALGALVYLVHKKAGAFFRRRGRKIGSVLRSRVRRARGRSDADLHLHLYANLAEVPSGDSGPPGEPGPDLTHAVKLLERVLQEVGEVNTSVKDANNKVAGVSATLTEASAKLDGVSSTVTAASTKIDGVGSGVAEIRAQLDKAGHAAVFWNVSSFVFGAAGVVLGVITLHG